MNWQEACAHPNLRDLPFKIELNGRGQVILSPTILQRSTCQGRINALLGSLTQAGRGLISCAVETRQGTKVADVAWASDQRFKRIKREAACSIAPKICIEVFTECSTLEEGEETRQLYLEQGAKEVWFCDRKGALSFYNAEGPLKKSARCPAFPAKIKL